ncbi:aldo/keto reductase [Pseudomonas sp. xss_2]|uniref:aldo/keto reductase n=1 Tax=Pseudomonas sp. xss_2 TaxID=3367215 RepID=UPI00370BB997
MEALTTKSLVLGTALWGWGVGRQEAFGILDSFIENGGSLIDTATNYPINQSRCDFGLSLKWLEEWVRSNQGAAVSVLVKIGSIDNSGGSSIDLTEATITATVANLQQRLGDALSCVSVHWDNRGSGEGDLRLIEQTVSAFTALEASGLSVGLSGIGYPEHYLNANPALSDKWIIQVKENFATQDARSNYSKYFPKAKYLAYGINLGGVKLQSAQPDSSLSLRSIKPPAGLVDQLSIFLNSKHGFEPTPNSLNELALAFSYVNAALSGVIVGPRNIQQLVSTMEYWGVLHRECKGFNDLGLNLSSCSLKSPQDIK